MTVAELIEALQDCPQDYEVFVDEYDTFYIDQFDEIKEIIITGEIE